jgi:hypothetical protein
MIIGARQHAEHVAARQPQKGAKTVVFRPGSLPYDFCGIACRKTRSQFLACLKRGEPAGGTKPQYQERTKSAWNVPQSKEERHDADIVAPLLSTHYRRGFQS